MIPLNVLSSLYDATLNISGEGAVETIVVNVIRYVIMYLLGVIATHLHVRWREKNMTHIFQKETDFSG